VSHEAVKPGRNTVDKLVTKSLADCLSRPDICRSMTRYTALANLPEAKYLAHFKTRPAYAPRFTAFHRCDGHEAQDPRIGRRNPWEMCLPRANNYCGLRYDARKHCCSANDTAFEYGSARLFEMKQTAIPG